MVKAIVVGAGIGGLTTAALLAHRGYEVKVFDQAIVAGGCASTFKRQGFTFDVGATQVAGLEPGGIHHRIFTELGIERPEATPCDPACAVYLPGETEPINVWRDPDRWRAERERQFPGSQPFWQLLADLFKVSWDFQGRDPVLPPRSPWDLIQLLKALRPETLITVPHTFSTVGGLLRSLGLGHDQRLKTFLDMQLKLYSQVDADETALLYAATALAVSQAPCGLWHLQGSMQVLSDRLEQALTRDGGSLHLRHRVTQIHAEQGRSTGVTVQNAKGESWFEAADHVVANVTVQDLVRLLGDQAPAGYRRRVDKLAPASGAFVVYLGVDQAAIPIDCPPHLQFLYDADGPIGENNSLFVSVSHPGDGRAPDGQATIVASSFVDPQPWRNLTPEEYVIRKQQYLDEAIGKLHQFFTLEGHIRYCEAATPSTFARFTDRLDGIVGGVGMRLNTFGPFGLANRTPIAHLWLVGDSTHPGEGTAGVSYSALTVVRQITES
jgi:C-3',4' desaturase CrtD